MSSKIPKSSSSPSLAVAAHSHGSSSWGKSETANHAGKAARRAMSRAPGESQHLLSEWVPLPKEISLGNWEGQQVPAQCVGKKAVKSRIPKELQRPNSIFPFSGGI